MSENYLILGASSEVGTAFIRDLNRKNAGNNQQEITVVAHYRKRNHIFDAVIKESANLNVHAVCADLSEQEQVMELLQQTEIIEGCPTHILHLPAEKLCYEKLKKSDFSRVTQNFGIQTGSLFLTLQKFLPMMAKNRYGKIVVMLSSVTIGMPPAYMTDYTINKYALLGLIKSAAVEYGDKGININGISPSMMETKFLEQVNEKIIALSAETSKIKRNITVEEVLPTIHYLFSEASDYMNGTNINLSGGDC